VCEQMKCTHTHKIPHRISFKIQLRTLTHTYIYIEIVQNAQLPFGTSSVSSVDYVTMCAYTTEIIFLLLCLIHIYSVAGCYHKQSKHMLDELISKIHSCISVYAQSMNSNINKSFKLQSLDGTHVNNVLWIHKLCIIIDNIITNSVLRHA
jgi:hypothetical protein